MSSFKKSLRKAFHINKETRESVKEALVNTFMDKLLSKINKVEGKPKLEADERDGEALEQSFLNFKRK